MQSEEEGTLTETDGKQLFSDDLGNMPCRLPGGRIPILDAWHGVLDPLYQGIEEVSDLLIVHAPLVCRKTLIGSQRCATSGDYGLKPCLTIPQHVIFTFLRSLAGPISFIHGVSGPMLTSP